MTLYVAAWVILSVTMIGLLAAAIWGEFRLVRRERARDATTAQWEAVAWVEEGHVVTGVRRILGTEQVALVEVDRVPVEDIDIERARHMAENVISSAHWREIAETAR